MAEIPISVATNFAQKLVDQAINETRYLCCFSNIAEDYENEKKKLTTIQKNVDDDVKEARDKNEEIVIDVKDWQSQVANMTREDIDTKAKKNCFFRLLPNCIWLYRKGKDLERMAQKIKNLIESSKFDKISRPSTLPGMEFYSSEDFMQFESRNLAQNELHEVLKNGDNYMIGLHGAGGSGKTKLVIQVGKEVQKPELFEKVIFVVVSSTPNVRKIQDEIASALGCSLDGDEFARPKKLWTRLRNGQKILIILDDVWEKLKLEDTGIPSRDNHEGCYVLLTTRDSKVCDSMGCQKIIHLNLLPKTEAWILFQRFAGISDASTALKDVAREIASRCKGLPVAITTMARTLKGHPLKDWKDALRALRSSTTIDTIDEELKDIYKCLRVSYDNLKSEKAKRLFLLCSMFPQDHEIPIEEIIRYGIGSGLFGEMDSYHTNRVQASSTIDKLTRSCLLLKSKDEGYAKMHDLIHDVAHLIAKNEIQEIVEPKSTLKALQEDTAMKQNEIRYLYCHYIKEFAQLDLQNSEILILVCNNLSDDAAIPDAFFDGMKGLKVLTLKVQYDYLGGSVQLMPRSLGLLKNLRTLNLRKCNLGEISVLEALQKIETLELYQCAINELPKGIVELKKLRLFRLESCEIKGNPYKVIGRFSNIEELYVVGNIISSGEVDSGVVADLFDKNRISPALERYHIEIGVDNLGPDEYLNESMSRALSIGHSDASVSNATIKDLMQRAEILCLHKVEGGYKSVSPDFFEAIGGAMNDLIKLGLYNCSQIECLVDTSKFSSSSGIPTNFLEKLERLTIVGCHRLKSSGLFVGNLNLRTLRKLQFRSCPELTYLFTFSIAQSLMLLEVLEVISCDAMKCIIKDEIEEIAEVDHDQGTTMDSMFPKLKLVAILECGQLECFSSVDSNKRQLSDLNTCSSNSAIINCGSRGFFVRNFNLRSLRLLFVSSCPKLTYLFTVAIAQSLVLLEDLDIRNCDAMKCIIEDESGKTVDVDQRSSYDSMFPKLERLRIDDCDQLECFLSIGSDERQTSECTASSLDLAIINCGSRGLFVGNSILRKLRELFVWSCPKLTYLFTVAIALSLVLLEGLYIRNCDAMKCIIEDESGKTVDVDHDQRSSYDSMFPKLKSLGIRGCNQLECLLSIGSDKRQTSDSPASSVDLVLKDSSPAQFQSFFSPSFYFPNLTYMWLSNCPLLKSVFTLTNATTLQLERFEIEKCDGLKHIITIAGDDGANYNSILPKLRAFDVAYCEQLEYVFGEYHQNHTSNLKIDIHVPALIYLKLENLPNVVNIFSSRYYLKCQSLKKFIYDGCPKFAKTSAIDFMERSNATQLKCNEIESQDLIKQYRQELQIEEHKFSHSASPNVTEDLACEQSMSQQEEEGETETMKDVPQATNISQDDNIEETVKQRKFQEEKEKIATSSVINSDPRNSPSINQSVQEYLASVKAEIVTPSSTFEPESSLVAPFLTFPSKVSPKSERRESQKGTYTRREKEAYPINLQDLENDDLIALFQSVEEDADIAAPTPSTEDSLVTRVLSDLEVLLKMPLKDIANSDANILKLLTALNFLSGLPLKDGALSEELKTIIHSLHQNFPTILASFKQASSKMDRFALLEQREESIKQEMARRKDQAPILVSNISKTKRFVDEAAQMEASLNEKISELQEELNNIGNKIKDCEAQLSALEEQKKECIAETIGFKKELEDLKREKSQTVEDQRKARQILVDADYKWSALCSQFQQNHILAGIN